MKKIISMLLVGIMSVSLVACGGKNAVKEINMNEPIDVGNVQFTLTEIGEFEENYNINSDGSLDGLREDGYSFVLVYFTVKNIGKRELSSFMPATLTMNYADGYTFSADKMWYYSPDTYTSDLKEQGVYVNSLQDFSPFDEATKCAAAFKVPNEIEDSEEAWSITIKVSGEEFLHTMR